MVKKLKRINVMKIKVLLLAALVGAATLSSAQAGVHFSFWFNAPVPVPVVTVAAPAPCVVTPPAPVVCAPPAPVVYVTPPVVTVATACPGPGYVWAPGYWSGRVWVAGGWHTGPAHYVSGHDYYHNSGHYGDNGHNNGWHR
jgi:hypothetical protein